MGAQWHMPLQSYQNYKTVHRRFQQWRRREVLREPLKDWSNTLLGKLQEAARSLGKEPVIGLR